MTSSGRGTKRISGNARGGIPSRIVMAIATLVVVGAFIVMLLDKKGQSQKFNYDNALIIAEYGLSEALMKLQEEPRWRAGFADVAYNEGTYRVTLNNRKSGDTLLLVVESEGRSGAAKRMKTMAFRLEVTEQGDSSWQPYAAR